MTDLNKLVDSLSSLTVLEAAELAKLEDVAISIKHRDLGKE